MRGIKIGAIAVKGIVLGFLFGAAWQATAQDAKTRPFADTATASCDNCDQLILLAHFRVPKDFPVQIRVACRKKDK